MDTLRKRIPFQYATLPEEPEETRILDDQEQDYLIEKLRDENSASNGLYLLALQVIVGLSFFLHFIYLLSPSKRSPILALFPADSPALPIPLSTPLALLALAIHANLALILHPNRTYLITTPLPSYTHMLAASALAPCLSLFLGRAWQTVAWWCLPGGVVWLVETVQGLIDAGNMNILELEKMKYHAPGA